MPTSLDKHANCSCGLPAGLQSMLSTPAHLSSALAQEPRTACLACHLQLAGSQCTCCTWALGPCRTSQALCTGCVVRPWLHCQRWHVVLGTLLAIMLSMHTRKKRCPHYFTYVTALSMRVCVHLHCSTAHACVQVLGALLARCRWPPTSCRWAPSRCAAHLLQWLPLLLLPPLMLHATAV
jgi:hypothetical protein